MTGGMGGGHSEPAQAPAQPAYQTPQDQYQQGPACQFELKQFIECTQTQSDISLCQGFNEILKNCKLQYGKIFNLFSEKGFLNMSIVLKNWYLYIIFGPPLIL